MKEEWKILKICNEYEASNKGQIRRISDNHILPQYIDGQGYYRVAIKRKPQRVHRLVAETFLQVKGLELQVNHIDGVKTNNNLDNLEWVTRSENIKHAHRTGLAENKKGKEHSCFKVNDAIVAFIRFLKAEGFKAKYISNQTDLHPSTIRRVLNGSHFNAKIAGVLQ